MRSLTLSAFLLVGCMRQDPPRPPPPSYAMYGYAPPGATAPPPLYGTAPPPPAPNGDPYAAARQRCLDETNAYRARLGVPPVALRGDKHACSDADARGDATHGTVHGGSGQCGIGAQNECPGWDGAPGAIVSSCLASMFNEGPGEPYSEHGHFINMTNREYRGLACGFFEKGGQTWMVQNYFF